MYLDSIMEEELSSDNSDASELLSEDSDNMMEDLCVLHEWVSTKRYLYRGCSLRKSTDKAYEVDLDINSPQRRALLITDDMPFLNESEFLEKYRMKKKDFYHLHSLVSDHPVFKQGGRGRKQRDSKYQLMVLLKYLGGMGTANSNPQLRHVFRCGRGTNHNYRTRAANAVLSLADQYYSWPDEEERKTLRKEFEVKSGFPNCVGMVDGTLNGLASKPQTHDSADYKGRKGYYTLSTCVINDHHKRIRYIYAGWPGSVHDSRVLQNSHLYKNPQEYFSEDEYLLADSAYQSLSFLVPSYKKLRGQISLAYDREQFNKCHARSRAPNENTIGIWKARFPWLRMIPMRIRETQNDPVGSRRECMKQIVQMIMVTVILHNYLIDRGSGDVPDEWMEEDDDSSVEGEEHAETTNCFDRRGGRRRGPTHDDVPMRERLMVLFKQKRKWIPEDEAR